jgi:hypothetical protein
MGRNNEVKRKRTGVICFKATYQNLISQRANLFTIAMQYHNLYDIKMDKSNKLFITTFVFNVHYFVNTVKYS